MYMWWTFCYCYRLTVFQNACYLYMHWNLSCCSWNSWPFLLQTNSNTQFPLWDAPAGNCGRCIQWTKSTTLRLTESDKISSLHVKINPMTITEREGINQTRKPEHLLITENQVCLRDKVLAVAMAHSSQSHTLPLHPKVHIKKKHTNDITLDTSNDIYNQMVF